MANNVTGVEQAASTCTQNPHTTAPSRQHAPVNWDRLTEHERRHSELEQAKIDIAAGW